MSQEYPTVDGAAPEEEEEEERIAVQLENSSRSTRRKFLVTGAAVWATATVAGCSGTQGANTTTEPAATTETTTAQQTPESPKNYVVTDDMAAGSEGIPEGASFVSACSPTRKFVPGMHAIWHVGVYDPETGNQLSNDTIDSMRVEFTNRDWEPAELTWAGDDEDHPSEEWNGSTTIPQGAETGTVQYKLTVSNGDAEYRHVGILANEFEVISYDDPVTYVVSNYTYAVSSPAQSNGFVSACGPEWQYMPGMKVAFAANIFDAKTGKEPGPDRIDEVKVRFPDGNRPDKSGTDVFQPLPLEWQGDAGEHAEAVWESSLDLPEDAATGTYTYEIAISSDADQVFDVGIAEDTFTVINPND